jgi:hypothetical protein
MKWITYKIVSKIIQLSIWLCEHYLLKIKSFILGQECFKNLLVQSQLGQIVQETYLKKPFTKKG